MSLDIDSLRSFVRVAEVASFTQAAAQLGVPKARVSHQVGRLEERLGCRLLQRSTRSVRLTADGEQLLSRARALLADIDELEAQFSAVGGARGRVRIDLPIGLAREVVIPRLPALLAANPRLDLQLSTTDRIVDVVREGFDCVLRVGALADSELTAIPVGCLEMVNCASPDYLRSRGFPTTIDDLDRHDLVFYSASLGADEPEFEWTEGAQRRAKRMRASVTVNGTDAFRSACLAGLGVAQLARIGVSAMLERHELEEVLPTFCAPALPVTILHAHGARVPRRVRAVMDWLAAQLRTHSTTPLARSRRARS
jgi:DNA-binding transcriptional LysR family regulator